MQALRNEKTWTYEDYRLLPDDGNRYEILEGVLYMSPAPLTLHQLLSKSLYSLLLQLENDGRGWVFYAPIDVLMPGATPVQPDLVFVAIEQRQILTSRGIEGVPKLIVEVLSPSNARYDRITKLNLYARCGVSHYWLLDPLARSLEVFRLDGETYRMLAALGPQNLFEHPEFPGLRLDIDALFSRVPPEIGDDSGAASQ